MASWPAAWTSEFPTQSTTSKRSAIVLGRSAHRQRRSGMASCSRRNRAAACSIIASLPSVAETSKPRRASTAALIPVPQDASSRVLPRLVCCSRRTVAGLLIASPSVSASSSNSQS